MIINPYHLIGWFFVSFMMWRGIYVGFQAVFG